jgi:hypothetical protein
MPAAWSRFSSGIWGGDLQHSVGAVRGGPKSVLIAVRPKNVALVLPSQNPYFPLLATLRGTIDAQSPARRELGVHCNRYWPRLPEPARQAALAPTSLVIGRAGVGRKGVRDAPVRRLVETSCVWDPPFPVDKNAPRKQCSGTTRALSAFSEQVRSFVAGLELTMCPSQSGNALPGP